MRRRSLFHNFILLLFCLAAAAVGGGGRYLKHVPGICEHPLYRTVSESQGPHHLQRQDLHLQSFHGPELVRVPLLPWRRGLCSQRLRQHRGHHVHRSLQHGAFRLSGRCVRALPLPEPVLLVRNEFQRRGGGRPDLQSREQRSGCCYQRLQLRRLQHLL